MRMTSAAQCACLALTWTTVGTVRQTERVLADGVEQEAPPRMRHVCGRQIGVGQVLAQCRVQRFRENLSNANTSLQANFQTL